MTLLKVWLVHTCLAFPKHLEYSTSHHTSTAIYLRRLSAILWPISHRSKYKRTRMMVVVAWLLAPVCSLPQVTQISPSPSPDLTLCSVSCSACGATPSTPSTSSAPPSAPSRPRRRYGLLYLHYTSNNCIMYHGPG